MSAHTLLPQRHISLYRSAIFRRHFDQLLHGCVGGALGSQTERLLDLNSENDRDRASNGGLDALADGFRQLGDDLPDLGEGLHVASPVGDFGAAE